MKHCLRDVVLLALVTVLLGGTTASAEPLDGPLKAEVESLATKLTDGIATFIGGDAHWAPKETPLANHVIVLFGLTSWAGGNGTSQFMAVVRHNVESIEFPGGRRFRPYQLVGLVQVGSDHDRWFKAVTLQEDRVILAGSSWKKGDAHCCPSGEARTVYRVTERGLNEMTR